VYTNVAGSRGMVRFSNAEDASRALIIMGEWPGGAKGWEQIILGGYVLCILALILCIFWPHPQHPYKLIFFGTFPFSNIISSRTTIEDLVSIQGGFDADVFYSLASSKK
jgi:hypothetical protein